MTISSTTRKAGPFIGNDVTVNFPFTFKVFSSADVRVVIADSEGIETEQILGAGYSVALNADQNTNPGGSVITIVALVSGSSITLLSKVANLQPLDLTNSGGFYPEIINAAFDRAVIQVQQLAEEVSRGTRLQVSTPADVSPELPAPLAGSLLGWSSTGKKIVNVSGFPSVSTSAFMAGVLMSADEIEAKELLGIGTISIKDYGGVGDGVTNNSPMLAAARTAAAGRKIIIPAGTFKFNSALSSGEDLVIEGQGDDTILDFTGATGLHGLNVIGTTTVLPDLAIPAVKNERTVEFVSPPPLIQGDVFCIYNPTDFSWSGYKYTDRAGEWCEVLSVSGNVVTLTQPLYEGYAVADVDLYRMNSPKAWIRNIKVIGNESLLGLINTTFCKNPYFEGVSGSHKNNSVISIDRCYKHVLVRPDVVNVGDGAGEDDYGIVIGNSQHGRTYGGSAFGRRHGIAHGGLDGICSVPFRDNIHDGVMLNNDKNSGVEAADFHSNGELNEYRNCTIKGGAKLQGKDNFYRSCKIRARQGGVVVHHAGVKGGTLGAIDCDFFTEENPQVSSRGIYDIGGNNIAVSEHTVLPVTFLVENCRLNGKNLTSLTTFILFNNRGCTQKVNFKIDGLTGDVDALSAILRTNVVSGTANSDFIIVDRISGFNTGAAVALHTAVSSHYSPFPHRLQKQTGSVTLSAASGTTQTTAAPINFKYTYPKAPSAHVTTVGGLNGNRIPIATLFSITGTQIRPIIHTGDAVNWTATADRDVKWTASLDEV